jgi:hypothetical protein
MAKCTAFLAHGPGHQSRSWCEVEGEHDVHVTHYHGECASWRNGEYTDRLRAKEIEFDPESYPENMAMTGFFRRMALRNMKYQQQLKLFDGPWFVYAGRRPPLYWRVLV